MLWTEAEAEGACCGCDEGRGEGGRNEGREKGRLKQGGDILSIEFERASERAKIWWT